MLDREGFIGERYVTGRNRKLQDQVVVGDNWRNRWVVYYSERGSKWDIRKHRPEDEVCRDLLSRLRGMASGLGAISLGRLSHDPWVICRGAGLRHLGSSDRE